MCSGLISTPRGLTEQAGPVVHRVHEVAVCPARLPIGLAEVADEFSAAPAESGFKCQFPRALDVAHRLWRCHHHPSEPAVALTAPMVRVLASKVGSTAFRAVSSRPEASPRKSIAPIRSMPKTMSEYWRIAGSRTQPSIIVRQLSLFRLLSVWLVVISLPCPSDLTMLERETYEEARLSLERDWGPALDSASAGPQSPRSPASEG